MIGTGFGQTSAPRSLGDLALGSLGVGSALASAGFAAYMMAIGPSIHGGRGAKTDFPVFTTFDRRARLMQSPAAAPDVQPEPRVLAEPTRTAGPPLSGVDFTPTGSIGLKPGGEPSPALPGGGQRQTDPVRMLAGYSVHDVFDGKAVIEARNRLTIVEPGSTIEGAGTVLAIRRQGNGWVVETAGGVIGQ